MLIALTRRFVSDDLQNNWTASNSSTFESLIGDCTTLDQHLLRLQDNIRDLGTRCTAPINVARVTMLQDACAKLQRDSTRLAENAANLREGRNAGRQVGQQSVFGVTELDTLDTDSSDTTVMDSYLDDPHPSDIDLYTVREIRFDSPPLSPRQQFLCNNNPITVSKPCNMQQNPMTRHRSESGNYKFNSITLVQDDKRNGGYTDHRGDTCRSMPDVTLQARPCRRFTVAGASPTPWTSAGSGSRERARSFSDRDQPVVPNIYRTEARSLTAAGQRQDGVCSGSYESAMKRPTLPEEVAATGSIEVERVRPTVSTNIAGPEESAYLGEGTIVEDTVRKHLTATGEVEAVQTIRRSPGNYERINGNLSGKLFDVVCNNDHLLREDTNSTEDTPMQRSYTSGTPVMGREYYAIETTKSEDETSRVGQRSLLECDGERTANIKHDGEICSFDENINLDDVLLAFDSIGDASGTIETNAGDGVETGDQEVVEAAVQCCSGHSPDGAVDADLQNALSSLRAEQAVSGNK